MKTLLRGLALLLAAGTVTWAVQPIVNTGQVPFGSSVRTITSSADVLIDTTTHKLTANKGIVVSTLTFADGTKMVSTNTVAGGAATWGSIGGTLSSQSDLQTVIGNVGTSTASLRTSINAVAVSTGATAATVAALVTSTTSLQSQLNTVATSTASLGSSVAALSVSTASLAVSTTSLQSQLTSKFPVSLSTSVTGVLAPANLVSTVAYTTSNQAFSGQNSFTGVAPSSFTYGVVVGSLTVVGSTPSLPAQFDGNRQLTATAIDLGTSQATGTLAAARHPALVGDVFSTAGSLTTTAAAIQNNITTFTSSITVTSTSGFKTSYGLIAGSVTASNLNSGQCVQTTTGGLLATTGGPCAPVLAGASALAITTGTSAGFSSLASSPTAVVVFDSSEFNASLTGSATAYVTLSASSATMQGNTFNTASRLVQMNGSAQLPAVNANLLTNLNGAAVTGNVPAASLSQNAVVIGNALQTGATFYVSSGTVENYFAVNGGSITNVSGTKPLTFYSPNYDGFQFNGPADFTGSSGFTLSSLGLKFKNVIAGSPATASLQFGNTMKFQGVLGSVTGVCSDLSTPCVTDPVWLSTSASYGGAQAITMDATGKLIVGAIKHKDALLQVGGSALVGTGYSDVGSMPPNGLRVMGNAIFNTSATIVGSTVSINGVTYNWPATGGTDSQVLTVTGSSNSLIWAGTAGGGDMVRASTQTSTGAKTFQGGAGGNSVPVTINQLDSAANGLVATSTGTGSFQFNINGRPGGGEQNLIGGVTINGPPATSAFSPALLVLVDSTTNNTNGAGLAEIWEMNPNSNRYLLSIHGSSTRNSDEPIRFDGPTYGIDEVSTSTDSAHGLGKWKVISIGYQTTDLQLASSRAWDNSTFEHLLRVHQLSARDSIPGMYLSPQSLDNDSAVLTSSDTTGIVFEGVNGSSRGLTGPLNPTGSALYALPNETTIQGQVWVGKDNGRGNNFNVRSTAFTTGGTTGQKLKFNAGAVPTWQNDTTSITSVQIGTTTPDYTGELFYITDGTNAVCVSSGTTAGAIVTMTSRATHCN